MKVIPLLEGVYHVDANKDFHYIGTDRVEGKPEIGYYLYVRPFLIQHGREIILIDAGYGAEENREPVLLKRLRENNINANQITKVLISHLHKDHANGLGSWVGNQFLCNFPEAKIYIQEREYNYAISQTSNSYNYERLQKMKSFKNIVWMNDIKGQISDEISFEVTGGHVPFQQEFWIKEDNEITFFGADNLPQLNYLKFNGAFKNDVDGKKAKEDRLKWVEQGTQEHWNVLLYHGKKVFTKQF